MTEAQPAMTLAAQPDSLSLSERLAALAALSAELRGAQTTREALRRIVEAMPRLLPADAYAIWQFDERTSLWHVTASAGLSASYTDHPLPGRGDDATLMHGPLAVEDVRAWPVVAERRAFYDAEGIVSIFVVPISIRGAARGTLTCYFRTSYAVPVEIHPIATLLADIASSALTVRRFDRFAEAARIVAGELDLQRLVQAVTDAATEMTSAQFGAFFYNVIDDGGESYTLYTISGVPREAFSRFPMPRNTAVFEPTFSGSGVMRSADIRKDPRYGKNAPYHGMPAGHLPVVSYLAVPVISRAGEVLGGLFFGHEEAGVFTEAEEQMAVALAAQAAVGIDNVRLYNALRQERERLARNEARYKSLVLATPKRQAIWLTNAEGQILEDLPEWREITGMTREELAGEGWIHALHPADRERAVRMWQQAVATLTPLSQEFRMRISDGSYRWFRTTGVPVTENGRILEWVGTTVDIHDERIAEEGARLLMRASEVLASSLDYEELLRNAADLVVPDLADWCAIDLVDEQTGEIRRLAVAHVDPAKVELAHEMRRRYPPDPETDMVRRVISTGRAEFLPHIPPELIERGAHDAEHLEAIRALQIMSVMVVPLRTRDHILGAISLVSSDSQRRFTEADLRLAEDFGRRATAAIENARLYRDAQAANRAKDEFLATLSHELRTPMTAVIGWARMLRMGLEPQEAQEAVEAIEKSASVQSQLIEDILDMSRIMAGKLYIEAAPVDLRVATSHALAAVHPTAAQKGIELLTSFTPGESTVCGDEGRLQQIVWNLLTNAIKFTPPGGRVELHIDGSESHVRLSVRDSGEGIDPHFLPHVFEPFRQQDSSSTRAHGGIGLGLAIVRRLVELHHGSIRALSDGPGRGATFVVDLPRMQSEARPTPVATQLVPLDGLCLLVIDDQPETRDVLAAILRRCRASVMTVSDVRAALAAVDEHRFDAIICDIAMPGEDGYDFVRALRRLDSPAARTPVIAATAFGRPQDRENALRRGFDAYLQKPIEPALLSAVVRELV
ncbi:MAG TPA: GAF domain-containing protein [Thermoanaerobaculia bacterium]|jgi:PAS domain S-box-containing protein